MDLPYEPCVENLTCIAYSLSLLFINLLPLKAAKESLRKSLKSPWLLQSNTHDMVKVLKFWTLVASPNAIDKQCRPRSDCFWRSSLIRVFPVCYSDMYLVNPSPDNPHFFLKTESEKVFEVLGHLLFYCCFQGGIMEIMVLRSAMGFDPSQHQWKVMESTKKEHGVDPKIIREQLGQSMYMEHVKFVTSLHQLTQSNKTIMTLLFVIELFSPDRASLGNKEFIAKAQEKFSFWLQNYLNSIMPVSEAKVLYPKLLVKLLDVRNLGEFSAKLASHLDIQKLEPLLIEVFSLQKWCN